MKRALRPMAYAVAALLVPGPAYAWNILEKDDPQVEQGNAAYAAGKYDEALADYETAAKEKPESAELQFNRGNALYKLGRHEEAHQAYQRALGLSTDGSLKGRDYYNLGNTFAEMHQEDEAIRSYRRALQADPKDADARHNLEVMLLRKMKPPQGPPSPSDGGQPPDAGKPNPKDGGGEDAGPPDAGKPEGPDGGADGGSGSDGGADGGHGADGGVSDGGPPQDGGGKGDGGGGDGGSPQRSPPDGGQRSDGGADGGNPQPDDQDQKPQRDGGEESKPLDQQDAERILENMRRNEKNNPLWKMQNKKPRLPAQSDKPW